MPVNEANDFLERFAGVKFPHAEQLVPLLKAGHFSRVMRFADSMPCRQLSQIFQNRADMLEAFKGRDYDPEMWHEFRDLAHILATSPDKPCTLWLFISAEHCFSAFEMTQSGFIAGCLHRNGLRI